MIIKANIREALRSLTGAKQRTLLALIGIVIGIGSVIAMVSVGIIVKEETLKQFTEMGTDIVTVTKGYSSGRGSASKGPNIGLAVSLNMPQFCDTVTAVAPYTSLFGTLKYAGERMNAPALGVTESSRDLFKLDTTAGRYISDLDEYMYYCVISPKVADLMYTQGAGNPVGEKLVFEDRVFTVVGVLEDVPMGGMRPYELSEGILMPVSTSMRFPKRPPVQGVTARLAPGATPEAATAEITQYYAKRSKGLNLRITSAEEIIKGMRKQMQMFTLLLGAIGSISLVVGGVGVMNVMLVSVSERKKEIGIRRALGALAGDIQTQFLIEALLLSFVGGMIGIALGVGASYAISKFSNWAFFVTATPILLGVGVSAAVGIFFGFYPARKAAKLKPIDALRSE